MMKKKMYNKPVVICAETLMPMTIICNSGEFGNTTEPIGGD